MRQMRVTTPKKTFSKDLQITYLTSYGNRAGGGEITDSLHAKKGQRCWEDVQIVWIRLDGENNEGMMDSRVCVVSSNPGFKNFKKLQNVLLYGLFCRRRPPARKNQQKEKIFGILLFRVPTPPKNEKKESLLPNFQLLTRLFPPLLVDLL